MITNILQSNNLTGAENDNQVINFWLSDKSPSTVKTYNYSLKMFFDITGKSLREVNLSDLIKFKTLLIEKKYKPSTVNNKLMAIKSLLSFCHRIGYIYFNVGAVVKSIKERENINDKILMENEIKALIANTNNSRDALVIRVLASTGLRISELVNLSWNDLKLGKLTVFGKGGKTRFIPLSYELLTELRGLDNGKNIYIFTTNRGGKMARQNVHKMLKDTAKKANLNLNVSCHWLRHSFASHALNNGATLNQVKEALGHGSINTTARYLHTVNGTHATDFVQF